MLQKKRICLWNLSLVLTFLFLSPFCHSQPQKIYLHPKSNSIEKQSKFIDSIRLIPLEIKEEIELSAYNSVDVTKNYFLIRDYTGKRVLVYSRNGKFITKINYNKLDVAPFYDEHQERIVFMGNNKNYTLTARDRLKIRLDWSNPRNLKYYKKYTIDLNDTTFTIKKDKPNQNDILEAYHFYDDLYWQGQITTSELYKDSMDYELKIYNGNKLVKGFFPYNQINETRFLHTEEDISVTKTGNPYIHFVSRPYYDTVYKMIKDSIFPAFQLVLPVENSLPASFFTRRFKNKIERDNFRRSNAWVFRQVHNFYETPSLIYFLVSYQSNYEYYIYQKETRITYKVKNIKPDSTQYNLKLLGDFGFTRKGDRFYQTQKAGSLITFFAENKNVPVPKELENFLKSNPHENTPVIVEFKVKN